MPLDPTVIDASSLTPKRTTSIFLPIGIEGQADSGGTAVVGTPYIVTRGDQAVALFGPSPNKLSVLVQAMLNRGAGPVIAVASVKGVTAPTLTQRQAAWQLFEADENIRIRLTDSTTQADLVALCDSAANANLIYNKQVALVGTVSGTDKAGLGTIASAIASGSRSRCAVIGPGVYDENGTLRSGSFAAACVAAELAKNADPSNDLDLWPMPFLLGIEQDSNGLPVFRRRVISGVATDDFEDLLQAGVSPLQSARNGEITTGVTTTHIRTADVSSSQWDNLYTRVIVDQIFLDVKAYILAGNFLRMGNTAATRSRILSGVTALLAERVAWISPVTQLDGSPGYGVTVVPSDDQRSITVGYQGTVVRGISSVSVAAQLTIPV